jgi:hypothetical protein
MDHRGDTGLDPDRGDGPPTASGSRPRHGGGRHRFEDRQLAQPVYRPELPGHDTRGWEPADEWDTGQWQWGTDTGEWQLGDLAELDPDGEDQDDHRARAALMLCRMHGGWRATSVSLAAALIGGGFTTAFFHLTGG